MPNLRVLVAFVGLAFGGVANAYCPVSGGNTSYEFIDQVAIDGTSQITGDDLGYGDYTGVPIELSSRNFSITLTPGFHSSTYTEHWSVWVDVDADGIFDTTELLFTGSGQGAVSGTINLPQAAVAGDTDVRVIMQYGTGASSPCAAFSWGEVEDYTITIPEGGGEDPGDGDSAQTPWRDNAPNNVTTGVSWNYAMGYHFSPEVDGQVTGLGGLFDGTKSVRLFDRASGELLAETVVSASNDWVYTDLAEPVDLTAGNPYTVAVYLAGSGAAYHYPLPQPFPQAYGDILIEGSTYAYTGTDPGARPTNLTTGVMYGVADIRFVPGDGGGGGDGDPTAANCSTDDTVGLANQGTLTVGPSEDIVPLCSGWVLLTDRNDQTVKLINIANGSVGESYPISGKPGKLALDSTSGMLYATVDDKPVLAKIDLDNGTVTEINIDYPAIDMAIADDGKIFAIVKSGTAWWDRPIEIIDPIQEIVLTLFEPSRQTEGALLIAYDAVGGYLITGDSGTSPSSLTRYIYDGVNLIEDEFLWNAGTNGQDLNVSPDGQHLAFACGGGNGTGYTIFDYVPGSFSLIGGEWATGAYPRSADFNASSTLLAAVNYDEILVYDIYSKVQLHLYKPPLSSCSYSTVHTVRFSRGGAIVYGITNCGFDDDSGKLVWTVHGQE